MADSDDGSIPVFPVAGWSISFAPEEEAILLQLSFLSHLLQKPEEADPGRTYVLKEIQVEHLRDALDRALQKLRSAGPPTPQGPQH